MLAEPCENIVPFPVLLDHAWLSRMTESAGGACWALAGTNADSASNDPMPNFRIAFFMAALRFMIDTQEFA